MAKVTVTNNTQNTFLIPSPISKTIGKRETKSFTGISMNALNQSKAFLAALLHGSISVTVAEDPKIPDALEVMTASDVDAKIAAFAATLARMVLMFSGNTIVAASPTATDMFFVNALGNTNEANHNGYVVQQHLKARRITARYVNSATGSNALPPEVNNILTASTTVSLALGGVSTSLAVTIPGGCVPGFTVTLLGSVDVPAGSVVQCRVQNPGDAGAGGFMSCQVTVEFDPILVVP